MKILMISYTSLIQELYHGKPRAIAAIPEVDLTVLVSPYWKEFWSRGKQRLEARATESYSMEVAPILFAGNLHFAMFRKTIGRLIGELQPEIIDIEDEPFNAGSAQVVFLRNRHSPRSRIVMHASQNDFKRYPPPFNLFERYSLRNVQAFLARSGEAMEVLRRKGFAGPIEVISHGVDTDLFAHRKEEAKKSLGLDRHPVIGFVGSFVHHKGLDILLKATQGLNCRVLLVGDGAEKESLMQLARELDMEERVILHPPVLHREIPRVMAAMDVFVLPSRTARNWREKFGRVLIEAMAAGVPVVGSLSGEIPNVLADAGLTFPEEDADSLCKHLQRLLSDPVLRVEIGRKGRERAENNYSWKGLAARTYDVYKRVLGE